ncbi:MAG: DUF2846 domain-containing protein [Candidatus Symbiothrix sp.]|jgi:hypothetical protein|nr:DUF2846 domain-containing protein [Candidatus Symbiothrix sp.]
MKKLFLILFSILVSLPGMASADVPSSKIIIYREPSFQGSLVSFNVFINDTLCAKLKNNSYYEYDCVPGSYVVSIDNNSNASIYLKVEEGRDYYLRFGLVMGLWITTPELILVDNTFGERSLKRSDMKQIETISASYVAPKSRIGVHLGGGGGFKQVLKIPIVSNNGRESTSTLSFGGGFAIGAEYGRELTKYFDLAIGLDYQVSSLTPTVEDITFNFSRGVVSATPSVTIPIGKQGDMSLKIGPGLDVYFGNKLKIADKDGAMDYMRDTWHYQSTLGYHAKAVVEIRLSDIFSGNFALRFYNVDYKFDKSGTYYPYNTSKLYAPSGAGIDLTIGIFYHF